MRFVCSMALVDNIARSRRFYEDFLRLKVVAGYGENVSFEGGFAIYQKAHFETISRIHIPRVERQPGHELYFEDCNLPVLMDNVDS